MLNRTRGSRPGNKHTARQLQRDLYLRVDGEEFSLAEVVRAVDDVLVVVVVVVNKRHVVVLVVQGTGDVKLLVDYLTTQSQSGSSTFAQPETRCAFSFGFSVTTLEAHRDEEEHHAGEGETAGVAQVACKAGE